MAGRGPAPKPPEERARARFAIPERGEWSSLSPLDEPVLPELPDGTWTDRARRMWDAWRADWVTQAFGPSEIAMAVEAIYLFERMVEDPKAPNCAEFRQWVDRLGLNLKGKRDLRLRLSAPKEPTRSAAASKLAKLRLVDDNAVPG